MSFNFGDRLARAVRRKGTPVVVGLDPRWKEFPEKWQAAASADRTTQATAVEIFCRFVLRAVADLVPAVKIQCAFFEYLGIPGLEALSRIIAYARKLGLLVIVDAKRGDIGSTSEAYAEAFLAAPEKAPWPAHALTVSPYLGEDALEPFIQIARQNKNGVFVLVRTSNPGARKFQDLRGPDGLTVYQHVADWVEEKARENVGFYGLGDVGAVVGATYPEDLAELRERMPHAWILVPGYGAQGATARDVAGAFLPNGLGAIINNSRGLIFAFKSPKYQELAKEHGWPVAVRKATLDMIADLRAETPARRLLFEDEEPTEPEGQKPAAETS